MKTLLALLAIALTFAFLTPSAEARDRRHSKYYDHCSPRYTHYDRGYRYRQPVYYSTRPVYYGHRYERSYRYNDYDYYPRTPRFSIYFSR